jgi:uncharacterized membrane-anchored protein YhcB (DUF1043 family)
MRTIIVGMTACVAIAFASTALGQTARPSDKAVVSLIETVQKDVKNFERNLDRDVARGKFRGPNAEVDIAAYLDDFDTNLDRLRQRFKKDYSASAEVLTVLKHANGVDRFIASQPPTLKGRSEWDVAKASLNQLAAAYGTTFPAPDDASARRINDGELQQAADAIVKHSQAYRKTLADAYTKDEKAALQTAQKSVDALSSSAKQFKSRITSGEPATGQVADLGAKAAAVETGVAGRQLTAPATETWKGISAALGKINQEFGVAEAVPASKPAETTSQSAPPAAAAPTESAATANAAATESAAAPQPASADGTPQTKADAAPETSPQP